MRYIIFVLFSILFFGCDLFSSNDEQEIVNGFQIITIEEVENSQWESGVFYQATEESGLQVSSISEVTNLLNAEISKDISIKSAWYKEQQSSCGTPNGIAYQVEVPSTLVIQLGKEITGELSEIFKPVNEPQLICPYYIKNLQPTRK